MYRAIEVENLGKSHEEYVLSDKLFYFGYIRTAFLEIAIVIFEAIASKKKS
jgi:hypothetical protein